ncbi:MAG: ATP synthase F1 subunit delta [Eggerthellaceae bacterium]|nr:ATP synthase F1 subunit delta [Eggerthellaceae bacterium]
MPTNRLLVKEQIATYTQLLFEAAKNDGGAEGVLEACVNAKSMVKALRSNADLEGALKDPGYSAEQKAQIVRGVFAGASGALLGAVAVMAERGELDLLPRVAEQLEERMGDELNLVIVNVETAVELDDNLREQIKKKAESELGKSVVLRERVDKSIIGGIIMSTKDERIDASLLTRVERTREALKQ